MSDLFGNPEDRFSCVAAHNRLKDIHVYVFCVFFFKPLTNFYHRRAV